MSLLPIVVSADAVEIDGIYYKFGFSEVTVSCNPDKYSGDIVIPESVIYFDRTYPVKNIEDEAFFDCNNLTSIRIPHNITHIGRSAFYGCTNLQIVNITDLTSWCNINFEEWGSNPLHYAHQLYLNGEEIKDLIIPETVDRIRKFSFSSCNSINSITIPESVTTIEDEAFYYCSGLTALTIPKSVTSIGLTAFRYCCGLLSVQVETGNRKYDSRNDCNAIIETATNTLAVGCQNTRIPSSVTSIGNSAFYGCLNLSSISIPNSITSIGIWAFSDCKSLHTVTIPESVTSIGMGAFHYGGLTSVVVKREIPLELEPINSAFPSSATLYVPDGCLSIYRTNQYWKNFNRIIELKPEVKGMYFSLNKENMTAEVAALNGYESYRKVIIPTSIANNVVIPSSITYEGETYNVKSIGESAFYDCDSLMSIVIPSSVASIGESAFHGCNNLSSIVVESGNKNYDSRDNSNALIESSTNTLIVGCKKSVIPRNVTSIGANAFYNCGGLTFIEIPKSVKSIGENAFNDCSGLTSVTISEGVTYIGDCAFTGSGITSLAIPNSVTTIGLAAFGFCTNLTSIIISGNVNTIGLGAFVECPNLTTVIVKRNTPPDVNPIDDMGVGIFSNPINAILYVPNGCVNAYKNSKYWNVFKEIQEIKDLNIKTEIDGIYYKLNEERMVAEVSAKPNNDLYSGDVAIPSSVTYNGTTYDVTSIGENAFQACGSLTSITIPESVKSIGDGAFSQCFNLTSIAIPNGVTSIGHMTFSECLKLTSVTIPDGVTTIGVWAFQGCSSLTSITIPNGVTSVGEMAFARCFNLSSVTIGNTVNTIGSQAFMKCSGLKDVYCYAEQVPNAPENIFDIPFVSSAVLHVLASSVEAYRAKAPWSGFGSIVPLEGESEDDNYINGIYYDFSDNEAKVIKGENPYSDDVVIPASVTYKGKTYNVASIGDLAFFQCSGLTSISIPNSVQTIGELAFATCSGLTSIYIPESVTTIGVGAFAECTGLTSISIPESMTAISESLFSGCSNLTSVIIPKGVTSIGEEAFAYCSKLKNVYCFAEQVPNTADNAFENTPIQSAVLEVSTSSAKEQYKKTAPWSGFATIKAQTDEEIAEDGPQLENSSFDEWNVVGSGNQALYNPWKEGGSSYWDTGNRGATTVGASNNTYGIEDGRTYANLQSKFIVIKFAAGNIFTGSYLKTDGTNGILSLGRSFNGYPSKLQFDYTYKSSIVNRGGDKWSEAYSRYISQQTYDEMRGKPDSCCIWIALIGDKDEEEYEGVTYPFIIRTRPSNLHLFDPNNDNVIAYGQFTSGDDQPEWTTRTISLKYRHPEIKPKYIIVVASSSKYGDYFIGGDQSLLQLDNLKLLYDGSVPFCRETFFAEQANGVQMEFGYISKENRTCQVGSGTRPCISTEISGGIDIPSEVEGYTVVGVGEKAFYGCSDLTSVTIPNSVTCIGSSAFSGCRLRNVLLRSTTPAFIDEDTFSKNIYNHTILYIPNGSWGEYVFNSNWYQFINIRETTIVEEQLSMQQTYTLMDANTFAYSVYDPVNDCIGTISSDGINEDNPNHCWQVIEAGGNSYLYNLGAKKYATSLGNGLNLTNDAIAIELENGKNGIILGKQEGNQWTFVSNERMNIEQSIADAIIAAQGTSHSPQTDYIYDLQGRKLSAPQKGLNIIRMSDGTTRKVMIK